MRESRLNLDIISKYRSQIYGFAALWVIIHHGFDFEVFQLTSLGEIGLFIKTVGLWGNMSVDIFLFLSGISLYFSWTKNNDLNYYIKERCKRIMPSFLLIVVPGLFYVYVLSDYRNIQEFFVNVSTLSFWFKGGRFTPWYVSGVIFFYMLFPFIYSLLYVNNKRRNILYYIFMMSFAYYVIIGFHHYNEEYYWMIELVLCRLPIFITGVYFGQFVKEKKEISNLWWLLIVLSFIVFIPLRLNTSREWYYRLSYIVGAIPLTYILAKIFEFMERNSHFFVLQSINGFFKKTGTISFEVYLAHVMFIKVITMDSFWKYGKLFWLLGMVGSYIVSFIVLHIVNKSLTRIKQHNY